MSTPEMGKLIAVLRSRKDFITYTEEENTLNYVCFLLGVLIKHMQQSEGRELSLTYAFIDTLDDAIVLLDEVKTACEETVSEE